MAIFSAILAWLGRQITSIIQAILGWSVTALFGRLPSSKQTGLAVALVVSLLWPVLVVGIFLPAVSAWVFAFVPLQKWIGEAPVRWVTFGLAVVVPWIVAGITRWVAPAGKKPSLARTILLGYPLTLGYALACLLTAVTVPLVRAASAARGWHDEHVFVQPRVDHYRDALEELARACEAAGRPVSVETVPRRMLLATRVLEVLACGLVTPIVAEDPKMLRGDALELYLYPADLLLRGKAQRVAHVRAKITRSAVERYAFLVSDPGAQELEEEIQRMWQVVARHEDPAQIGRTAHARLREISRDLDRTVVPFDQWVALDRSLHRLERALSAGRELLGHDLAARDVLEPGDGGEANMAEQIVERGEPTGELLREALDETRELVRLEVALARDEIKAELRRAKAGAVSLGAAAALALCALTMFFVTIAAAFAWLWLAALIIGGILLCLAGALGLAGWKALPKQPMPETKERLETDLKGLKERIA